MKGILIASLALVCVALGAVVDLTPENFDSVVDGSKAAFVEFYAPWCGHCKNLAPAYEQVGEALEKFKDKVVVAKVDADAHKELGGRFEVRGFPTLKFFPKGSTNPEAYEGGRSAEEILNYINNKVGTTGRIKKVPSNVVDLTPANFDKIVLDSSKDVLVEFYAPWCGHCKALAPDYEKVANAFAGEDHVVIAKVDADAHRDLGSKYGVSGFPTIKFFSKTQKETPESYESARDVASFVKYINEKAGTKRLANGRLDDTAGRIQSLDLLAAKFVADGADQAVLLKEAEAATKILDESQQKSAKIYIKAMTSIKESGKDYVTTESARLDRMMDGSVSPKKMDEFTVRKNILASFA